jgi:hypothetical protein
MHSHVGKDPQLSAAQCMIGSAAIQNEMGVLRFHGNLAGSSMAHYC